MGIRFQLQPQGPFHDIILRSHARSGKQASASGGALGVNLFGALHLEDNTDDFISSLANGIGLGRISDMLNSTEASSKNTIIVFFVLS